ncbi:MAG: FkbM family methyltransferase [Elusimicrobia bacterium]|nr:FkbM family methyltransferase [Elusimicrobiota bacterium]
MSSDKFIERLCSAMHWVFDIILRLQTRNPDLLICEVKYRVKDGTAEGFSQYGQDLFCFHSIFGSVKNGVFVDVGANHPKLLNNTYYFEKNGWHGLAFEPQERLRKLWDAERKTKCLPYVLGGENKEVTFIETPGPDDHVLAGVEGFNKIKRSMRTTAAVRTQRRLDEVLLENQVRRVDYLSIDVEGYEMNVLSGLDLSKIDVKCIDIENDSGEPYLGSRGLRRQLLNSGYRQVARLAGDDIFVKK